MTRVLLVALLSLAAQAAAADATGEAKTKLPKVAVLAVHAEQGVSQGSANLLLEILTSDIQQSGRYEVISPSDITAMVGYERQKALIGCTEESCLSEIGSAIGADQLIDTSVGTIGNLRVLAMKLLDVKVGKVLRRETETVGDDNQLIEAGHRLVAKLLGLESHASSAHPKRGAGIGVMAAGGALAVGGVVFGVLAEGQLSTYRTNYSPSARSGATTFAGVADGMFGAALIAGIIGTFFIVSGGSSGANP